MYKQTPPRSWRPALTLSRTMGHGAWTAACYLVMLCILYYLHAAEPFIKSLEGPECAEDATLHLVLEAALRCLLLVLRACPF